VALADSLEGLRKSSRKFMLVAHFPSERQEHFLGRID
jgi:hypothetical protein